MVINYYYGSGVKRLLVIRTRVDEHCGPVKKLRLYSNSDILF